MNTLEAIATRKSTRNYKPEQIPEEALQTILEAGYAAPAAMARYDSLHITVVQNQTLLDRINAAASDAIFKTTGVRKNTDFGGKTLLFVSSMPIHRVGTEYINVGIVMENMVLAATDLGIDSVILGGAPGAVAQDPELVKDLGIPEGYTPMLGVVFGYGAEDTPVKKHTITVNRV
jgi:nitroreductase